MTLPLLELFPANSPKEARSTLPSFGTIWQPITVGDSNLSCFLITGAKTNTVTGLLLEVGLKTLSAVFVLLENHHLKSTVRHILPDVTTLAEFLKAERARLCISDSGVLLMETSDSALIKTIETKPVLRPPMMERVRRCLVKVCDSNG